MSNVNEHQEFMKNYLVGCYVDKDHSMLKRYSHLLVQRAVRFYIENHLDREVVAEDLLKEDGQFPNLDYSNQLENKYIEDTYRAIGG